MCNSDSRIRIRIGFQRLGDAGIGIRIESKTKITGIGIKTVLTTHWQQLRFVWSQCEPMHWVGAHITKKLPHLQIPPRGTKIINNLQFTAQSLTGDDICIPYLSMIFVTRDAHIWAFMEHPKHDSVMGNQVENHCTNLHLSGAGELW